MNALNSILIEGKVVADSVDVSEKETCYFKIKSTRFYKKENEMVQKDSVFEIKTTDKLAQACIENLSRDRGIRAVGRLDQCDDGTVIIVAEHVEFKPIFKS